MLYACVGSAGLALDALHYGVGMASLEGLRGTLVDGTTALAAVSYLALGATPRLPLRVFLPLSVFAGWWALGGLPLPLLLGTEAPPAYLGGLGLLSLVVLAGFWIRRANGRRSWLFTEAQLAGPLLSPTHTLVFALVQLVLLPPALLSWLVFGLAWGMEQASGGFVSFDAAGMRMAERRYRYEDWEVVLVGMVHVGERDAYRELYASFVEESTVVLQEGVTNRELQIDLDFSYDPLASALGLGVQPEIATLLEGIREEAPATDPTWPHVRHADVDVSEFAPGTVELLSRVGRLLDGHDLRAELLELLRFTRDSDVDLWAAFERDLISLRNRHLIAELNDALESYRRVVVPWGALHMPELERSVLDAGFEPVSEQTRPIVGYGTIWSGLARLLTALVPGG